jgi:hypothetical protein
MKIFKKAYVMATLVLVAFTLQISAQSKRTVKTKKNVVKRTVTNSRNNTTSKRVSSNRVIYKTQKKKVISVRTIPSRTVIKHRGLNYYYSNNKYYTQSRGRYIVIAPKIGFRIKVLPANYRQIRFNNRNYFNVNGTFYINTNNEYEVVEPEIGTIVYELPKDYEKVVYDGQTYYEYANVLYEKVQVDGTRAYEVVGIVDVE